jgi:hypothetical protein
MDIRRFCLAGLRLPSLSNALAGTCRFGVEVLNFVRRHRHTVLSLLYSLSGITQLLGVESPLTQGILHIAIAILYALARSIKKPGRARGISLVASICRGRFAMEFYGIARLPREFDRGGTG